MREEEIRGRYGHFVVPGAPSFEEGLRDALRDGAAAAGPADGVAISTTPQRISVIAYDLAGQAVGVLRFEPRTCGVEMIATRDDAQRRGIGRRMWQAAMDAGYRLNDAPPGPMTNMGLRFWLAMNPRPDYEDD